MNRPTLTAAAAAALFASGAASAAAVSDADRNFLSKDVQGARYELALAKTAEIKALNPQVRSYSRMLVQDHVQANAALMRLAKGEGVMPPAGMTSKDQQTLAKLKAMSGTGFDKAYLDEITKVNAQDETDSDREKSSTHDQKISAYIQKFSAMDAKHKKIGEDLKRAGV